MIYVIVYKTTCLVNGKIYIGQHYIQSQKTLDPWYIGSGTIISVALIGNTNRKGKKNSKEHNEAISRANKGKKRTEEQKKRMSEALKGRKPTSGTKGVKFSEEARLHMSISAKEAWKIRKVQNIRMQSTKHFN